MPCCYRSYTWSNLHKSFGKESSWGTAGPSKNRKVLVRFEYLWYCLLHNALLNSFINDSFFLIGFFAVFKIRKDGGSFCGLGPLVVEAARVYGQISSGELIRDQLLSVALGMMHGLLLAGKADWQLVLGLTTIYPLEREIRSGNLLVVFAFLAVLFCHTKLGGVCGEPADGHRTWVIELEALSFSKLRGSCLYWSY